MKIAVIILIFVLGLLSCKSSDAEIISKIKKADDYKIERTMFGGIAGSFKDDFHLKTVNKETILIHNEGTDLQSYYIIDFEKKKILTKFIDEAIATNIPDKIMNVSCIGGFDYEYVVRSGHDKLVLRPSSSCDSLFQKLMNP